MDAQTMNHLIVEGPDGSGKSKLIEYFGLTRVHTLAFVEEQIGPVEFYSQRIGGAKVGTGFDRLWLSELVYGPVLRSRSAVSVEQARMLKNRFPGVPVIVCLPPFEVTLRNTRKRGIWPDYQTDDFLKSSYARFKDFADSELVDFVIDYTGTTFGASVNADEKAKFWRRSLGLPVFLNYSA
jgi:hypothetical protein